MKVLYKAIVVGGKAKKKKHDKFLLLLGSRMGQVLVSD